MQTAIAAGFLERVVFYREQVRFGTSPYALSRPPPPEMPKARVIFWLTVTPGGVVKALRRRCEESTKRAWRDRSREGAFRSPSETLSWLSSLLLAPSIMSAVREERAVESSDFPSRTVCIGQTFCKHCMLWASASAVHADGNLCELSATAHARCFLVGALGSVCSDLHIGVWWLTCLIGPHVCHGKNGNHGSISSRLYLSHQLPSNVCASRILLRTRSVQQTSSSNIYTSSHTVLPAQREVEYCRTGLSVLHECT